MQIQKLTLAALLVAMMATAAFTRALYADGTRANSARGFLIEYVQPDDEPFDPTEGATRADDDDDFDFDDEDDWYPPFGAFVQGGVTINPYGPADGFNGTVATNDMANRFQMNQLWLFAQRIPEYDCCWDWGYRADVLFGTDAEFYQMEDGLEESWQMTSDYQLALVRFYVDLAYNKWNLRLGRFDALLGFEEYEATENFFYSRSYEFNFGTPRSVLGAMLSYQITDQWEINAAIHRGSGNWDDTDGQDSPGFMGGFSWESCDKQSWFDAYLIAEEQGINDNTLMYTLVYGTMLRPDVEGIVQWLYGKTTLFDAKWYGINSHLYYHINECWSAGFRAEWYRDNDGVTVFGLRDRNPLGDGMVGNFYELTFAVNYKPSPKLNIRPELRYDIYSADNPGGPLPFDDGTKHVQFLMSLDVIYSY